VGPRAGLNDVEKRKFLTLPRLELRPSVVQPAAGRYNDYATRLPLDFMENKNVLASCSPNGNQNAPPLSSRPYRLSYPGSYNSVRSAYNRALHYIRIYYVILYVLYTKVL
jgi:hypothetical protein